jgi:hypothetical protein
MSDRLVAILIEEIRPIVAALVREQVTAEPDHRLPAWLTPAQAGDRLGIGASAVRERIRRGVLPAHRWENRLYVRTADIDAEIERAQSATFGCDHDQTSPRDVGASGGAATRSAPRDP